MFKMPLLIITICYLIGILMGLYLEINIAFLIYFFIAISIAVFIVINKKLKLINIRCITLGLLFLIVIISTVNIKLKENKFLNLYVDVEDNSKLIGEVIKVQKESEYYNNYIIRVKSLNSDVKYKNTNIILKVKKEKEQREKNLSNKEKIINENLNYVQMNNGKVVYKELKYGDLVYVSGDFNKPEVRRNYLGFDYSQYLKTKNVYMICIANRESVKIVKNNSLIVGKLWINNIHNKLLNNLNLILPDNIKNIGIALLLGDSDMITNDEREMFSDANLVHILAISGMHVSYVILILKLMLSKCDNKKSKYFMIVFLIFFSQLTGSSPSITRAVIMGCLGIISKLFYRKSNVINNIAISCFVIILSNPYNIFNLGFQLSFLGTIGIILLNKYGFFSINNIFNKEEMNNSTDNIDNIDNSNSANNADSADSTDNINSVDNSEIKVFVENGNGYTINRLLSKFKKISIKLIKKSINILYVSISANLLILPVLIYNYNTLSFAFLISNLLVTPILGIMLLSGYLTLVISLLSIDIAKIISISFKLFLQLFSFLAYFSSQLKFLKFTIVTPNLFVIIIYYILLVYFLILYKKNHNKLLKKIFVLISIIVLITKIISINILKMKIYFIDVGQGDSTLIITETNKKILIDGGGSEAGSYDIGEKVLVPYLLDRQIKCIDYLVFTHFDADHCEGLFTVMENLKVKNAVISKQGKDSENYQFFLKLANQKNINIIKVKARK